MRMHGCFQPSLNADTSKTEAWEGRNSCYPSIRFCYTPRHLARFGLCQGLPFNPVAVIPSGSPRITLINLAWTDLNTMYFGQAILEQFYYVI